MKKEVLGGMLGILLVIAGVTSFYFYLNGLKVSNNLLLLILAVVTFAPGVFILYRSGKIDIYKPNIVPIEELGIAGKKGQLIEKNNKLANEWKQTTEQADKLKLLSIQTGGGEGK